MVFTILVTGSRIWSDKQAVRDALMRNVRGNDGILIVHGGAKGADKLAGEVAREMGWRCKVYAPDWHKHKHAAGPIRNSEMLEKEKIDLVIAFPKGEAKGTRDMIKKAKQKGLTVVTVGSFILS